MSQHSQLNYCQIYVVCNKGRVVCIADSVRHLVSRIDGNRARFILRACSYRDKESPGNSKECFHIMSWFVAQGGIQRASSYLCSLRRLSIHIVKDSSISINPKR